MKTILVVDDTPTNLALVTQILEDDYRILVATSGARALRIVRSQAPPDLILLDIRMPVMNGFEVCAQLKADPTTASIPIIFLSGMAAPEEEARGLKVGAVDYLRKPFDPDVLLARVNGHVGIHKAARFVPQAIRTIFGDQSVADLKIGDRATGTMTVLVTHSRNDAGTSLDAANRHHAVVGPIVRSHHGFVHRFDSDRSVAVFPGPASNAQEAALAISKSIFDQTPGLGLHTADVTFGVLGDSTYWALSLSDGPVEIAAALARRSQGDVLMSPATQAALASTGTKPDQTTTDGGELVP
ncbi:MAG: response regulator [Proteobacteria bacterium]|nr:response regulator [Pseudomonadota bacterium]